MKPWSSLLRSNRAFRLPDWSNSIHHEVELVLRLARKGRNIPVGEAAHYYREIGLGIDFTARDIQDKLRSAGLPWEKAKAFDDSAVLGHPFLGKEELPAPGNLSFRLDINGKTVQSGNSGLMIFPFEAIISHVSRFVTLRPGDLIYTGTPAGVGPVLAGDRLEGYLEERKLFDFRVL